MASGRYWDLYSHQSRSGAPLGTRLFVVDIFTLIVNVANAIENSVVKNYKLSSGKIDIAADVAQLIFYVYRFNSANILADAMVRMLIVLKSAQDVIITLEQLNGFGSPCNGDEFSGNASICDDVAVILRPVDSMEWVGSAAGRYSARVEIPQSSAEDMATADRELAEIVHRQAGQVEQGREAFAGIRIGLYQAMPLAWIGGMSCGAFANPKMMTTESSREIVDPADRLARLEKYVYTVVGLAGVAALATMMALIVCGSVNADDMQSAIDIYRDIAH